MDYNYGNLSTPLKPNSLPEIIWALFFLSLFPACTNVAGLSYLPNSHYVFYMIIFLAYMLKYTYKREIVGLFEWRAENKGGRQ